jgi:hypothetical protein
VVPDPPAVDAPLPTVTPPDTPPALDTIPTEDQPEAELPDDDSGSGSSGGSTD